MCNPLVPFLNLRTNMGMIERYCTPVALNATAFISWDFHTYTSISLRIKFHCYLLLDADWFFLSALEGLFVYGFIASHNAS